MSADEIVDTNKLDDPNLVIGQTLTIPGAKGAAIPTPTPSSQAEGASGGGRAVGPAAARRVRRQAYTGGAFAWPVAGGSISQYYHYGHYAIDIAADYAARRVKAAASGTVIFAGWKSNGGGYQVWISHGSNLYTTYNHMSSSRSGAGRASGAASRSAGSGRAAGRPVRTSTSRSGAARSGTAARASTR